MMLLHGDVIATLRTLDANSIDSIVTDPPYGLEFMGKEWDGADGFRRSLNEADVERDSVFGRTSKRAPEFNTGRGTRVASERSDEMTLEGRGHEGSKGPYLATRVDSVRVAGVPFQQWCTAWGEEALRVLKPGGHILAFGGARTYHRLTCALEDAGFEIRDTLMWIYGSGFPKNHSVYRKLSPCPSIESAPHAVRLSEWHQVESFAVRERIALALVEIQPEGVLAIAMETGRADSFNDLTVMSLSEWMMGDTNLNTVSSWQRHSDEPWNQTSTFIIETATKAITESAISKFCQSLITRTRTIPDETKQPGCKCSVADVATRSVDGSVNMSFTKVLIAQEPAIEPLARLIPLGTSLKPAFEPIVLARKPLIGTVAKNVLTHGTGALNIDGCRVGDEGGTAKSNPAKRESVSAYGDGLNGGGVVSIDKGRWPANVILDEEAGELLNEQSGTRKSGTYTSGGDVYNEYGFNERPELQGSTGGASRFFYAAKVSKKERNLGLADGEKSSHPTVKPVALMTYLIRLITPPGGTVLDPFVGSGSTGIAAAREGFDFVGIDNNVEYLEIAEKRIAAA